MKVSVFGTVEWAFKALWEMNSGQLGKMYVAEDLHSDMPIYETGSFALKIIWNSVFDTLQPLPHSQFKCIENCYLLIKIWYAFYFKTFIQQIPALENRNICLFQNKSGYK